MVKTIFVKIPLELRLSRVFLSPKKNDLFREFKMSEKRIVTLRNHLGKASDLIENDDFLPMFRNRQIHFKKEFEESVKLAKKKRNPEHYFASIWSCKSLKKTLEMIRRMIYRAIEKAREYQANIERMKTEEDIKNNYNSEGRARLAEILRDRGKNYSNIFGL